jgi:hypothetical protein
MNYITIDDLLCQITSPDLADLLEVEESGLTETGFTNSILDYAEKVGMDTATAFLDGIFDMTLEFSNTGDTRDFMIVQSVLSVLLKTIYQRLSPNSVPQHVTDSYNEAIDNFKALQQRKYTPKVAERDDEDVDKSRRIYSDSNPKITYPY